MVKIAENQAFFELKDTDAELYVRMKDRKHKTNIIADRRRTYAKELYSRKN